MSENNNFEAVKGLLKLKRHEAPPPGFFNHFSGDIISRIRAGEAAEPQSLIERLQAQAPGLAGWLRVFETRPGVIGGFATSLCLLLLIGAVLADRPDSVPAESAALAASQPAADADAAPALASAVSVVAPAENSGIAISTNPATLVSLRPVATLFGQPQNPLFQPANFMPASQ